VFYRLLTFLEKYEKIIVYMNIFAHTIIFELKGPLSMNKEESKKRIEKVWPILSEEQRLYYAAVEAESLGFGGVSVISRLTGISKYALNKAVNELDNPVADIHSIKGVYRREPRSKTAQAALINDLKKIIKKSYSKKLEYIFANKNIRTIAVTLKNLGHDVKYQEVGYLLHTLGYSLRFKTSSDTSSNTMNEGDDDDVVKADLQAKSTKSTNKRKSSTIKQTRLYVAPKFT
jgi:hypothetical protein